MTRAVQEIERRRAPGDGAPGDAPTEEAHRRVPRWGATLALLAIGGIYLLVSDGFSVGPPEALLVLAAGAVAASWVGHQRGHERLVHLGARLVLVLVTVAVGASAVFLVLRLPGMETSGGRILVDASLIWVANVLTFAVWYWEVDGGGPSRRRLEHHASTDFLFPQMTMGQDRDGDGRADGPGGPAPWAPVFLDYLFLAFTVSTAFGPTDTLVLSHRCKLLVMLQSLLSLIVVAVLAARAINVL